MKVAICDDEKIMRNQIKIYIYELNKQILIDEYPCGQELLRSRIKYDIIFMDIEMPDMSGMETAEKLRENGVESHIIFLTSHTEYVMEAFKVKAFRFLTKPIDRIAFSEAFKRAESEISEEDKISINFRGCFYEIKVRDIVYIEASGDGSYIYDKKGNFYECAVQLREWEERLREKYFYKTHKSYIVSLYYIQSIINNEIILIDSASKVPVSRRNLPRFKEEYMNFIKHKAQVI